MNDNERGAKFIYLNLTFKHILGTIRPFETILMILTIAIGFLGFLFAKNSIKHNFQNRAEDVMQSTIYNIDLADKEIDLRLKASIIAINESFKNKKNYTISDLQDLSKLLHITTVYFFGKDGLLKMTTGEKSQTKEHSKLQETFSIINIEQCETQMCGDKLCRNGHEVLNCQMQRTIARNVISNPDKFFTHPIIRKISLPKKIPAKWMFFYSQALERLFVLVIAGDDFDVIIKEKIDAHEGFVNYISITDDKGNIITEVGDRKGGFVLSKSFGDKWVYEVGDKKFEYSYLLNMEFNKSELEKQSKVLGILFTSIIILIIILIAIIRNRIYIQNMILRELKQN